MQRYKKDSKSGIISGLEINNFESIVRFKDSAAAAAAVYDVHKKAVGRREGRCETRYPLIKLP